MKTLITYIAIFSFWGALFGCSRYENTVRVRKIVSTEEWVYTHVKRGMSKKQVIAAVGEPASKDKRSDRIEEYSYYFGITNPPKGHAYLVGFQVLFQDDYVETIYPVYGEVK